jgi:hypothetical protein
MGTNQHDYDESADTGSPRPDDPAVVAAAAGKTTPERSSEKQRQHQPSQRHNRGPPLDDDDEPLVERLAGGDLLVGADAIRAYLVYLGMPEGTDPYYLKRTGRWPIGNTGGGAGGGGGKLLPRSAGSPVTPKRSRAALLATGARMNNASPKNAAARR